MSTTSVTRATNIAPKTHFNKQTSAIIFVIISTFFMALQDAIIKLSSNDLPLWQIFTVRSFIAVTLLTMFIVFSSNSHSVKPKHIGWVLLRSGLIVAMYIAFYAALPFVDLSLVAAAYYTGPLFITIISAIVMKDYIGIMQVSSIILGFVGVLIILQPSSEHFSFYMVIPIFSAIFYAISMVLTKTKGNTESPIVLSLVLNFSFIFVGLTFTLLLYFWDVPESLSSHNPFLFGHWVEMGTKEWFVISILSTLNVFIHILLAKAYQSGSPPLVASFDYTYLIFASIWGFFILSEIPDFYVLIGMCIITSAGLFSILAKLREN